MRHIHVRCYFNFSNHKGKTVGTKKLVIVFSRPKSWKIFAELIMWWDKHRYDSEIKISHGAGKFVASSWERDLFYQAAGIRTHFMGGKHFNDINTIVEQYELEVPEEFVVKIGQRCVDREGKPYAIKQVLGQIIVNLVWLLTFGKIEIKNPWSDGDAETSCIEEWGRILAECLDLPMPLDLDNVSVKPFRDWIASLPIAKKIESEEMNG